jgi:hypothetical protein
MYNADTQDVTAHLPFNIHNRVLADDSLANSRSGSRSVDIYPSQAYDDSNARLRPRGWSSQERFRSKSSSRPPSIYDIQRTYSRPSSPDSSYRATIRREPILNVRLVGYVPPARGRSMISPNTAKVESPDSEIAGSIHSSVGVLIPPVCWHVTLSASELT